MRNLIMNILFYFLFGEGGIDMIAMLWAQQIMLGKKTFAQVPRLLKDQVREILIDSGMEELIIDEEGRKLQLHYWYVGEHEIHGDIFRLGHGIVTGHKKLSDAMDMHTSAVEAMHIDEEAEDRPQIFSALSEH